MILVNTHQGDFLSIVAVPRETLAPELPGLLVGQVVAIVSERGIIAHPAGHNPEFKNISALMNIFLYFNNILILQ